MTATPTTQQGMGAIPYPGGVAFRVWAPFAPSVFISGDFNAWSQTANPLASEGNGYWSADVSAAEVGQEYKFFLPPVGFRNDPYTSSLSLPNQNCIIASADTAYDAPGYATPAWNEMVIYELHIESFDFEATSYNGRGSLASAAKRLPYVADLGINAVELMPLGEFLGDFSTGYNPSYIFAVENEWGGPDGFRDFVNQAHRLGIAVILDVVYNHLGGANTGDIWQFDGWSEDSTCPFDPNKTNGGIYFYNDWRAHTAFAHTRFDYGRREVCDYLTDNALRWLEHRFVDGLRFDSVGTMRNVLDLGNDPAHDIPEAWSLLQRINNEIADKQPWKITIAEDMKENAAITRSTGSGGAGFGAQWGAGFLYTIRATLIARDDDARDMNALRDAVLANYNGNAFARVICSETHDAVDNKLGDGRVPTQIWPDVPFSWASKKRSTLGAALVMTAPGIPMIFMGQEFLESNAFDGNTELDWSKLQSYSGIHDLYRDLIHLRRNWFNTTRGLRGQGVNAYPLSGADKVLAFHRWDQGGAGDDVVVVLNFANVTYPSYTVGFPQPGRWRVRFNSDFGGYSSDFGNTESLDLDADGPPWSGMPHSGSLALGPYSCVILSQDGLAR